MNIPTYILIKLYLFALMIFICSPLKQLENGDREPTFDNTSISVALTKRSAIS